MRRRNRRDAFWDIPRSNPRPFRRRATLRAPRFWGSGAVYVKRKEGGS
ncbi:MAG: hypothetical protein AB1776_00140 [Bacillota bacterium]